MTKKFLNSCLILLVCLVGPAQAAPSYGTKMPRQKQFHFGGQTYDVQQRDLEGDNGKIKSLQHFLLISYGLADWLSLDLKGGAGDTHQKPDAGDDISYPAYLAGGYGFRLRFYQDESAKVVFGFQHISVHPYSVFIGNVKHKDVIDDWQFSLLVSQGFHYVTPYMGTRWSRMDYIHWVEDDRNRVKSDPDESIGLIVGTDVFLKENVWVNLEAQFMDVQALAASLNFHF